MSQEKERECVTFRMESAGKCCCSGQAALAVNDCDDIKKIPELLLKIEDQYNETRAFLETMTGKSVTFVNTHNTSGGFAAVVVTGRTHPNVLNLLKQRCTLYESLLKEAYIKWNVVVHDRNFNLNTGQFDTNQTPIHTDFATILV
jgi:hypothetical protein